MPSWDIDPAGVQGVVKRTEFIAEDLQPIFTSIEHCAQGAASNCASEIVAGALSNFLQSRVPDLTFLANRTVAAMTAAVTATNAYVNGDLIMAANAQASAAAAPAGEFSRHAQ